MARRKLVKEKLFITLLFQILSGILYYKVVNLYYKMFQFYFNNALKL